MDTITFVDETTGEVVEVAGAELVSAETMMTYARAKAEMDVASLALAERMLELQRTDPQALELAGRLDQARAVTTAVEASLENAIPAETRIAKGAGITLNFGFARITWAKPATHWTMKTKPEEIARTNPELANLLGIKQETNKPSAPRIQTYPEKLVGGLS